jgi:protoporphyrin/coproporphyrin ferrochelatase
MKKTAVILSNTGTPDHASVPAIRKYLREFLGDGRVITMPTLLRKFLVNGIIVPLRARKSAKLYKKVWTEKGSPLLWHSESLRDKLQMVLGDSCDVIMGMRYGNPSLKDALQKVRAANYYGLVIVPLFPQYASSTTGTILELVYHEMQQWNNIPAIKSVGQFYDHPGFIDCFVKKIREKDPGSFDHIIFTYHGLPLHHVNATHQSQPCEQFHCITEINADNGFCYHATCYATTRLIAAKLGLNKEQYSVGFQSRFAKSWLSPFADELIREKARAGVKKLLMVSPSFVTDCLETIVEIGEEYRYVFLEGGGEHFEWVESLNDGDEWVDVLKGLIMD